MGVASLLPPCPRGRRTTSITVVVRLQTQRVAQERKIRNPVRPTGMGRMVLGRSCMIARLLVIVLAAGNAAGFMPAFVHKHAAASHQHLGGVAGSCRSTPARPTSIRREVTRCAIIDGREELSKKVNERTRRWVEEVIIGYNICPFAKKPVSQNTVRYVVSDATNTDDLVNDSWREAAFLLDADPDQIATTLLMAPNFAGNIDEYSSMGYWMEDYLEDEDESIFEGALTIAVFHPAWTFEGCDAEDPVHFEKRSPYPTVSLLRREEMGEKVTDHFKRTGGSLSQKIQEDNTESLKQAGWDKLWKLLA